MRMTKRLEDALRRLTPQQVEELTAYAESFAGLSSSDEVQSPAEAQLKWVGALKGGPYGSGLEAQEAAKQYRILLIEKGMSGR
jgi:hypothetical protein